MKIVFAGTPQFAAEHLKILIASDHQICCILTQPDRRSGRGKQIKLSPVKEVGLENRIEVLQPSTLREKLAVDALKLIEPDLMLVVAYGLLVPKEVLNIPKMGCVNVHASILPNWRGAAPIENSIYSGDKETGITYMRMSEGLDEGPILEVHKCKIEDEDNLGTIENKFVNLSKTNLLNFLEEFENGKIKEVEQDHSKATLAPKITSLDQEINWVLPSEEIERKIRSLNPKYGAFTFLGSKRIKIFSGFTTHNTLKLAPGYIEIAQDGKLIVGCKQESAIKIDEIQMEGKGIVPSQEFVKGYGAAIKQNLKFSSNGQ